MQALTAGMWGGVAGASLVVGALMGIYARVPQKIIGLIMAFGGCQEFCVNQNPISIESKT